MEGWECTAAWVDCHEELKQYLPGLWTKSSLELGLSSCTPGVSVTPAVKHFSPHRTWKRPSAMVLYTIMCDLGPFQRGPFTFGEWIKKETVFSWPGCFSSYLGSWMKKSRAYKSLEIDPTMWGVILMPFSVGQVGIFQLFSPPTTNTWDLGKTLFTGKHLLCSIIGTWCIN